MSIQKIFLGNDHAGPKYVQEIKTYLESKGFEVEHLGSFGDESVDYPDFGEKVGRAVVGNEGTKGVVICGTGIGISIAANKVRGIIAANCRDEQMAELSRQHNNANVLGLGARFVSLETAKKILDAFFSTDFEGGRHERRVDKLLKII
jgi:ribose 5-phosphate isomerase B